MSYSFSLMMEHMMLILDGTSTQGRNIRLY